MHLKTSEKGMCKHLFVVHFVLYVHAWLSSRKFNPKAFIKDKKQSQSWVSICLFVKEKFKCLCKVTAVQSDCYWTHKILSISGCRSHRPTAGVSDYRLSVRGSAIINTAASLLKLWKFIYYNVFRINLTCSTAVFSKSNV